MVEGRYSHPVRIVSFNTATTKIHVVSDNKGRPCVMLLTPGNTNDHKAAVPCLEAIPPPAHLIADKGYDSAAFRNWLRKRGTTPVIPPRKSRRVQYRYDKTLYRQRNIIERMFGRLKDCCRIATRNDRSATNFLAAICLAATVTYWL